MAYIRLQNLLRRAVVPALLAAALPTGALAQSEYTPPSGKGRAIVAVSGQGGAQRYVFAAMKLAKMGYDVFLYDGNRLTGDNGDGLRQAVQSAGHADHALPGKVGVVGFSLGGGLTLAYATHWPNEVAVIVAMFPSTSRLADADDFVQRVKVPVLMLAGEADTYKNCCSIDTARAIGAAAKAHDLPFELVTYPNTDHDFVVPGRYYNSASSDDAWVHTEATLKRYLPDQ